MRFKKTLKKTLSISMIGLIGTMGLSATAFADVDSVSVSADSPIASPNGINLTDFNLDKSLVFSVKGDVVGNGGVVIWKNDNGVLTNVYSGTLNDSNVQDVVASNTDPSVFAVPGFEDNHFMIYQYDETGNALNLLNDVVISQTPGGTPKGSPTGIDFSPDDSVIAVANRNNSVYFYTRDGSSGWNYDLSQKFERGDYTSVMRTPGKVRFSPDGKTLVAAGYRNGAGQLTIFKMDYSGSTPVANIQSSDLPIGGNANSIAFSDDGEFLVVGNTGTNDVSLFELNSSGDYVPWSGSQGNTISVTLQGSIKVQPSDVQFIPGTHQLMITGSNSDPGILMILDIDKDTQMYSIHGGVYYGTAGEKAQSVEWYNNRIFVFNSLGGKIGVFDTTNALINQTITFTTTPSSTEYGDTYNVAATASSGLDVSLSTNDDAICEVDSSSANNASILLKGVGNCEITATQPGDGTYNSATETQSFTVTPKDLTIAADDASTEYGSIPSNFTATYSGLASWDSALATPETCSTAATSSSDIGTYDIECSGANDPNYNITYVKGTLTIDPQTVDVVISGLPTDPEVGSTHTATVNPVGSVITSTTPTICTVSGLDVTFLAKGDCDLSATWTPPAGNSNYVVNNDQKTIEVKEVSKTVVNVTITNIPSTPKVGDTYTLTVNPSDSVLSTLTPSVCTVSGVKVTMLSEGNCSLTATWTPTSDPQLYEVHDGSVTFAVGAANKTVVNVKITDLPTDPHVDDYYTLTVTPSDAVLSTSTPAICSVSGKKVTLYNEGLCKLDAVWTPTSHPENYTVNNASATINVLPVRTDSVRHIVTTDDYVIDLSKSYPEITPKSKTLPQKELDKISCVVLDDNDYYRISCAYTGTENLNIEYKPGKVTIVKIPQTIEFTKTPSAPYNQGEDGEVIAVGGGSGLPVYLESVTPRVCSLSNNNIVINVAGICKIKATQDGDATYAPADPAYFQVQVLPEGYLFNGPADNDLAYTGVKTYEMIMAAAGLLLLGGALLIFGRRKKEELDS